MASDNNIQHFSAADIERYHKGLLSPKERHAIEKAALDDPFLADALEGYSLAGVDAVADMAELTTRLNDRTKTAKVIPLAPTTERRKAFPMLRAAVVIAFVAGAALLAYQLGFNKKKDNIAITEGTTVVKEKDNNADTGLNNPATVTNTNVPATATTTDPSTVAPTPGNGSSNSPVKATVPADNADKISTEAVATEKVPVISPAAPAITPPAKTAVKEDAIASGKNTEDKELAKDEAKKRNAGADVKQQDRAVTRQETAEQANRAVTANRKAEDQFRNQSNIFRGRVTDADNNGIPFANVTNAQDNNAGTYTDAKGYFNLTSPDTVLNVQVRSIGFENNQVQLRNSVPTNQVVLQDDRKGLSEVVISTQKPNAAARSRDNNTKVEEPEPADGWEKYDSYLANNLKAPEEFKPKQSNTPGAVEVSFEIDKNGEPVKFKIEKSLCAPCDKEAIRLIKEGPKWKRKAKKGRTTVTINF